MSKAVKAAGLGLVIFATVWVVTIWQWYSTQRSVSGEEVARQLVLLPLALTLIAAAAWWGAARLRSVAEKPIEAPAAKGDASLAALLQGSAESSGTARQSSGAHDGAHDARSRASGPLAAVLAEAVSLSAGHDAIVAWEALRSGQVRPALDVAVQDPDGLPVFSARQVGLDTADWLHAHAELVQAAEPVLPETVLRSLALLEGPLHELLAALQQQVPRPGAGSADPEAAAHADPLAGSSAAHLSGVGAGLSPHQRADAAARRPTLAINLCLPSHWTPADRARAVNWVKERCGAIVDWMQAWGAREPLWQVEPPASPEALWAELSRALQQDHADPRPVLRLVMAADSLVDEDTVLRMLARGELFTHQHQGGRVPGEAAVGLLLANPAWLSLHGQHDAPRAPRLGWPLQARREHSADRIGRVGATTVAELMQQALLPMRTSHPQGVMRPWWVVSDGDHRASRSAELFEAVQAVQPELDPLTHVIRAGDACGDMGLARALVPVALAASAIRQALSPAGDAGAAIPALVSLVQCSHNRVLVPLWPASAEPDALSV